MPTPLDFPRIQSKHETVEVYGFFGAGGSKTVLDVSLSGLRRALAIPNQTDPLDTRQEKWGSVLLEAENAQLLNRLGLLTIPEYRQEQVSVDGVDSPALSMTPFPELPFEVFDGKDGTKTWKVGPLSDVEHFSDVFKKIAPIQSDIAALSNAGIVLKSDSISFAVMSDGTIRLFLYDLQGMRATLEADSLQEAYARLVVNKLDNLFDFEQSRRFSSQGYDFSAREELASKLTSKLTRSPSSADVEPKALFSSKE